MVEETPKIEETQVEKDIVIIAESIEQIANIFIELFRPINRAIYNARNNTDKK